MSKEKIETHASQGGLARAKALTPEERSEIAKRAVEARWEKSGNLKKIPIATHGSPDHPLVIGDIYITCYVLSDGRRVLAQRGLQSSIGLSEGGGQAGERRIAVLMEKIAAKGINTRDLVARTNSPIRFIPPHGGNHADGYEASILPDICAVLIEAQQKGALDKRLTRLAERASILQHGFATIGIIALVDEATGFQYDRARDALEELLSKLLAEELRRWVKTFPDDYFRELCRLKGYPFRGDMKFPPYFGHYTNDIVYKRLAPGVLEELKKHTPRTVSGNRQAKYHQWLSEDSGHPRLLQHLGMVIGLMKISSTWDQFYGHLNKVAEIHKPIPPLFQS